VNVISILGQWDDAMISYIAEEGGRRQKERKRIKVTDYELNVEYV